MKINARKMFVLSVLTLAWLLLLAFSPMLYDAAVEPLFASAQARGKKPHPELGITVFFAMFILIMLTGAILLFAWVQAFVKKVGS